MRDNDIEYIRILLTNRCNLSCQFCHKEGSFYNENDIDYDYLLDSIKKLHKFGIRKVKLMGGEPMLYKNIEHLVSDIKKIDENIDLSIITNAFAPAKEYINLFEYGLDRLNVSVHGWCEDVFIKNTSSDKKMYENIRNNITNLAENGKINKINYVLKKGLYTNDFFQLIDFAKNYGVVVDTLNLLVSNDDLETNKLRYSFDEIEELIRKNYKVKTEYVYENLYSLPSKRLLLENSCIINLKVNQLNQQNAFKSCKKCEQIKFCTEGIKAIRLTNSGVIQPCLLRNDNTLKLDNTVDEKSLFEYFTTL